MSSPMESPNPQGGDKKKPVSFQFCAECSNMLYPKEDEETRTLQFTCRTCHYTTAASNTCVFRNELSSTASLHAGITEGTGKDPTVGVPSSPSSPSSSSAHLQSSPRAASSPATSVQSSCPSPTFDSDSGSVSSIDSSDIPALGPVIMPALCLSCGSLIWCAECGAVHHVAVSLDQREPTAAAGQVGNEETLLAKLYGSDLYGEKIELLDLYEDDVVPIEENVVDLHQL